MEQSASNLIGYFVTHSFAVEVIQAVFGLSLYDKHLPAFTFSVAREGRTPSFLKLKLTFFKISNLLSLNTDIKFLKAKHVLRVTHIILYVVCNDLSSSCLILETCSVSSHSTHELPQNWLRRTAGTWTVHVCMSCPARLSLLIVLVGQMSSYYVCCFFRFCFDFIPHHVHKYNLRSFRSTVT